MDNLNNSYKFFRNDACEYFPCHKTDDRESFNCLFCYCPLYTLGSECGGNFKYLESGAKDCTDCMVPHSKSGYEYVKNKYQDIKNLALKNK